MTNRVFGGTLNLTQPKLVKSKSDLVLALRVSCIMHGIIKST